MIRNVIFDWSGTLVDDLPVAWGAANHVLKRAGRPGIALDEFRKEFHPPYDDFFARHAPGVAGPQIEAWFNDSFRTSQDSVVALPHALEFLEFCRGRGARMAVLSGIPEEHFQIQAAAMGFDIFFGRTYLYVQDKRKAIAAVLEENGFRAGETVFIGDMPHDIETAKHGGVRSCAVLTGYCRLEQLRAAGPDLMVEHLGELLGILERNQMNLTLPEAEPDAKPVVTVGALIFNDAGEVLMVRTHKWSDLWGIPGGKIKWGEGSEAALRRELREETDLEIADIKFVLAQDCIRSPEFYREAHFVLLNYTARCVGVPKVKLNDEAREFAWVTREKALAMKINQPTRVLLEAVAANGSLSF